MDMRPGALLGPFLLRGEAIWPAALQLTVRTMLSTRPAARDTATSRFSVSAIAIDFVEHDASGIACASCCG